MTISRYFWLRSSLRVIRYRCGFDFFNQDYRRIEKDVGECQLGAI